MISFFHFFDDKIPNKGKYSLGFTTHKNAHKILITIRRTFLYESATNKWHALHSQPIMSHCTSKENISIRSKNEPNEGDMVQCSLSRIIPLHLN